jgi:2-iminobutanoate/2-iminopropanoate deaminase
VVGKRIYLHPEKELAMNKEIINTSNAPTPIGPYNQAVKTGNLLFLSGQVALKPGTGEMANKDIIEETHQVMQNLKAVLAEGGMNFSHVVKTTIFLSDMDLFGQVNEIYGRYFESNFPARETVAVKGLPKNANVEISMVASI